jgi:hypothetical protein
LVPAGSSVREDTLKKSALLAAPTVALGIAMFAMPGIASASTGSSYEAQLGALNNSGGSGTLMLTLNGSQATITEHYSGLADKLPAALKGGPYPHVQHIHIGAKGECPTMSADANGDGVISTTEGGASYGAIGTTLSTTGDTSPAAGVTLTVAPTGASTDYKRTITLDSKTMDSIKAGTGVIVVHGLDPATAGKGSLAPSDLVPALPLAATSPALCGALKVSQMSSVPNGSAATGGGSTAGIQDEGLLAMGGALVAAGAAAGAVAFRRRSATSAS